MLSLNICFFGLFILPAVTAKSVASKNTGEPFTLEEYFTGYFSTKSFSGSWLTGDTFLHADSQSNFVIYDLKTRNSSLFIDRNVFSGYPGPSISLSADRKYISIRHSVNSVFRHSTTALYTIYDIENKVFFNVSDNKPCQIAAWTPIGHGLVYVYLNNIYYIEKPGEPEKVVTTNGVPGVIYNGVPDWVYEEEVLGSGKAFWFSPSGKKIAFASFDDNEVLDFKYFKYGTPNDISSQYPTEVDIRYPKVNTVNPIVHTYIANLETDDLPIEIDAIPTEFLPDDYVLYDMTWVNDDIVVVISTNRVQNKGKLVKCFADGSDCMTETTYEEDNGWLDANIPNYYKDGTLRLEILPRQVENDYFSHLVLTNVTSGEVKNLTTGRYVVTNIFGWNEEKNIIYFLGSFENAPSQRQVYSVDVETLRVTCLTCSMMTTRGLCLYASASFSKDFSYVTKICQGLGPYLVEIQPTQDAINGDTSNIIVWEDNAVLVSRLEPKALPVIKNIKVPIANGEFEANVRLLLPPNLDENNTSKKYPAVVYVYAGPNSNQITDAYSSGFQNYIVTNREYIYIYIDGRGSGRDGQNKMFQIYKKMGTVEIEDQIAVTKYLQETYPYIDRNRTGIWGWSYGGFATAWVLVQDVENIFKFGLSVAPVTNFILYDTIYTERYMGLSTPEDNEVGYNNTDLTQHAEAFRDKLFFLIHGNADDNVHYQQSMILARALEKADVQFRQQSYPDENHSLSGVSRHLYHTIDRFWARSFGLPNPPLVRFNKDNVEDKSVGIYE